MKLSFKLILGSLVLAVAAGLIVIWINKKLTGQPTPNLANWRRHMTFRCALPNLNQRPQSAASAYPSGAPVTNFRPSLQIGTQQVPAS